uniref:Uncharacterized protein n=1 Tax=Mesocestoides corti TaxID=53468 RepID=A0A5K3FH87_MESCO
MQSLMNHSHKRARYRQMKSSGGKGVEVDLFCGFHQRTTLRQRRLCVGRRLQLVGPVITSSTTQATTLALGFGQPIHATTTTAAAVSQIGWRCCTMADSARLDKSLAARSKSFPSGCSNQSICIVEFGWCEDYSRHGLRHAMWRAQLTIVSERS